MDFDITKYTGVDPRHLAHTSHVPLLPAVASHNDSDGVVTTLFVRRYSTAYKLEFLKVPLRSPAKRTNSQTYSGYLYAQYVGIFKGPYIRYRFGK